MAKKPKLGKHSGVAVTLVRTRPAAVQPHDRVRQSVLGAAFDKGAASTIYTFNPPLDPPRVAKIYNDKYRSDPSLDPFTKLAALVHRHEPLANKLPFVLWPDELIFDRADLTPGNRKQALLGFTMPPLPVGTISLFALLKEPRHRDKLTSDAAPRLAARLADHMAAFHEAGFVFCDMNPKNFHVTRDLSRVFFLDADGYQTSIRQRSLPSRGVTMGYASPAAIAQFATNPTALRAPDDDAFVLAILVFQLLLSGAHPFDTGPQYAEHPTATRNDNIAARRFAFANPTLYKPDADALAHYVRLVPPLKEAFYRSFLGSQPLSAADWARLLPAHVLAPLAVRATPEPPPSAWMAPAPLRSPQPLRPTNTQPRRSSMSRFPSTATSSPDLTAPSQSLPPTQRPFRKLAVVAGVALSVGAAATAVRHIEPIAPTEILAHAAHDRVVAAEPVTSAETAQLIEDMLRHSADLDTLIQQVSTPAPKR